MCRDHCSLNQQTVGEMLQLAKNYDKVSSSYFFLATQILSKHFLFCSSDLRE
jgi:hypothetical protein